MSVWTRCSVLSRSVTFFALVVVLLLPGSLLGQVSNGTVSTSGGSGAPGAAFGIPVTISLNSGVSVDTLSLGVTIIANGSAPVVSGLQFAQDTSLPRPGFADNHPANSISISWLSPFSPPLSGTRALGVVNMTIPSTAQNGQTYTLRITGANGAKGNNTGVPLTAGPDSTLTVTVAATPPAIGLNATSLIFSAQQGGANPANQSVIISNAGGGTLNWTTAVTSGGAWLKVLPASGSGSGLLTASVDITNMLAGNYAGAIQISATGASNTPQTIAVSLAVSAPPPPPSIALSLSTLSFSAQQNGANPANQSVVVSNSGGGTLNWTATVSSGSWLKVSPASGSGAGTLSVSANIGTLAAGSYSGTIQVSATGATNSPQTINVTLAVAAAVVPPSIAVSPSSLTFAAQVNGANPAAQSLVISNSGGGALNWTAAVASGAWLSVSPGSGTASGTNTSTLTIGVNAAGLSAGTLTGSIQVAAAGAGNTPQTLAVTLTMVPVSGTSISLSPGALQFNASSGTGSVAAQSFQVLNGAGSGALGWTASAATQSAGNWLTVSPSTGVAPSTLIVSVAPAGLAQGVYQGSITISALPSANAVNSPQSLPVSFTIDAPTIVPNGIVNGASFSTDAMISPGSIVSLFGSSLAPRTESATTVPLPVTLGGAQVLVGPGKIPAPLFYVSPLQINFQMPAEITGTSVSVVVVSGGITSLAASVKMAPAVPGIFTTNSSGLGQAAALNEDFTPNWQVPAAAGSVVQIFVTGLGSTNPPAATGQPGATFAPLNLTVNTPIVTIDGIQAEVLFSGLAPGFVGLYQVNARIPQGLSGANKVLRIQMNGQTSNAATIAVR